MRYASDDLEFLGAFPQSAHIRRLKTFIENGDSYRTLFEYGRDYLPSLPEDNECFRCLDGYKPEIVTYFQTLADLPSLPRQLRDLAIDLSIYANGQTVQTDGDYLNLEPAVAIENVLRRFERRANRATK